MIFGVSFNFGTVTAYSDFSRLALLAYMESAATHLTLTSMSFCCMRIQSFRRIPLLKALNERCSMNDMPSICMLLTFAPNSTDFVSLPLTMGRT